MNNGRDDGRGDGRELGVMKGDINLSKPLYTKEFCSKMGEMTETSI